MKPQGHNLRWLEKFLSWICSPQVLEFLQGDVYELYELRLQRMSKLKARWHFFTDLLSAIRPFAFKSNWSNSNAINMFKLYFKIAWRNLVKQKMYSGVKIGGLAIGVATCFLISMFIFDELSYDQYYKDKAQIYRMLGVYTNPENPGKGTAFPPQVRQVLLDNFDEIETVTRIIYSHWFDAGSNQLRIEGSAQNVYEERFVYTDPDWLDIFEVEMVYGNASTALDEPNSIVLTKSKADKYFPNQNPIGEIIFLNDDETTPYMIGGVMEDVPKNTHVDFDFILTLSGKEFWQGEQTNWCCWNYRTYIKVRPDASIAHLEEKLQLIRDNYVYKYSKDRGDSDAEEVKKYFHLELEPITDVYLNSEAVDRWANSSDIKIIWFFGYVAVFILLLACINFINLSTAKSANRAKEVGLRKVVGSLKGQLVRQFLVESFVYCLVSFAIGIILAWVALPTFNQLANKSLSFPWEQLWLFPSILGIILLVAVIAGLYPAFYLSAFKPVEILKGNLSRGSKNSTVRGSLVVFQFATSIVLIICSIITYQQMDHILNGELGFDKEQVIMVQGANTLGEKRQSFKNELKRLPGILDNTASDYFPVTDTRRDGNGFWKEGEVKTTASVGAQIWRVDDGYLSTMGMNLKEGRNFSQKMASDSTAIILNESMVKALGLKNPIGAKITNDFQPTFHVIGVVEDFHFENMKYEIGPLCLAYSEFGSTVAIKVKTDDLEASLSQIEGVWNDFLPNQRFRYTFLDDRYALMYDDVKRTTQIFTIFTLLAVIVACLGLFALSTFMIEQQSKEISIRKVLGASIAQIFSLLTIGFVRYVIIAIVVAFPVGWYLMNKWLEDYSYQVEISWYVFLIAGIASVLIALITVSTESIKAALRNPSNNLRSE